MSALPVDFFEAWFNSNECEYATNESRHIREHRDNKQIQQEFDGSPDALFTSRAARLRFLNRIDLGARLISNPNEPLNNMFVVPQVGYEALKYYQ